MLIAVVLAAAVAALSLAGPAAAATIGVNEDETKTDTSLYAGMADVGLKQNVLSVIWTPGQKISSGQVTVIRGAIAAANAKGIEIVLAIYNSNAPGVPARFADTGSYAEFVEFVTDAVRTFRGVKTVIIGNEPNRKNFMSPPNPGYYGRILSGAYAAVKSVDPTIQVLGAALSPRGDDSGNLWPTDFVKQLGEWYRGSDIMGANRPLMDGFSIHPYPDPENRAPDKASDWPQINMADLHRIKQAISDAFSDTPQKTVEQGLPLHIDEIAYQVPTEGKPGYTGSEAASVSLVTEQQQAEYYATLVHMAACDPQIASLNFFHFIDEKSRVGFQSGFLDLAKSPRPVVAAVKEALQATAGGSRCVRTPVRWVPTAKVIGARADLSTLGKYPKTVSSLRVQIRVEEHADVTVGLFASPAATLTQVESASIADRLADGYSTGRKATVTRAVPAAPMADAGYLATVELKLEERVPEGNYFLGMTVRSKLNPKRISTFGLAPGATQVVRIPDAPRAAKASLLVVGHRGALVTVAAPVTHRYAKACP